MPDRLNPLLRIGCILLLAGLLTRIVLLAFRPNPLADVRVPALPTLDAPTPTPTPTPTPSPMPRPQGTNLPAPSTNLPPVGTNAPTAGTNLPPMGTNFPPTGTNFPSHSSNTAPVSKNPDPTRPLRPPGMPPGMMGMGMPGMPGRTPVSLSPLVQARLNKIIQSELLGPAPRPLPMALLGIAGTNAFIRTPQGMSGMLGEGGELGGIKLLRIGINRVLVDEGGTNRELTIFGGSGGPSLLPQ